MLRVHQFSGFTRQDVLDRVGGTDRYFDQYEVSENKGWRATRAAGILAAYLAGNPDMTASAVAAWAYHNGLPEDWEINLDQDDGELLSGTIWFLDDYPLPSNFQELFREWASGYEIAQLPALPQPAAPVMASDPFQNQPQYQQVGVLPPMPATQAPIAPQQPVQQMPATQPAPQPTQAMPASAQQSPVVPKPQTTVKQKSEGLPIWVWIAAAIAIFIFMQKKGKKR